MENKVSAPEFFKCFSDRSRIDIINQLARGDSFAESLATALQLTPATVCFHLKKLEAAGIVTSKRNQYYVIYSLNRPALEQTVASLVLAAQPEPEVSLYDRKVLSAFIRHGRLVSIPVQLKKREVIYRYIIRDFEPGREYTEHEVNEIIERYHGDFCTIRREFITFRLMTRSNSIYTRVTTDD